MPLSISPISDYRLQQIRIRKWDNYINTSCNFEEIEQVNSYKYLGVMFDYCIKWANQK